MRLRRVRPAARALRQERCAVFQKHASNDRKGRMILVLRYNCTAYRSADRVLFVGLGDVARRRKTGLPNGVSATRDDIMFGKIG
jgi:hypothetical protein